MLTVTTSRCRNLTLMFAFPRAQPQVGENTGEITVPVDRALDELQPLRDRERRGRRHE